MGGVGSARGSRRSYAPGWVIRSSMRMVIGRKQSRCSWGSVALRGIGSRKCFLRPLCSDDVCEFSERDRDAAVRVCFDAEFVVTAPEVLQERVTTHDHAGSVVAFEAAHRSQS
jgi:hypothetical protein